MLSVVPELVGGALRLLEGALAFVAVADGDFGACVDKLLRKLKGCLVALDPDVFCTTEPNAGVLCPCEAGVAVAVVLSGPAKVFSAGLFVFGKKPPVDCDPATFSNAFDAGEPNNFPKAFLVVPSVSRCLSFSVPRSPVEVDCPRLPKGFEDAVVEPDPGAADCVLFWFPNRLLFCSCDLPILKADPPSPVARLAKGGGPAGVVDKLAKENPGLLAAGVDAPA